MTQPSKLEQLADMIRAAYLQGAEDVHNAWVAGSGQQEADFGEAASDYVASVDFAALRAAGEIDLLEWLDQNSELQLAYQGWDDDDCWQVHRVNGGRNDREWTLIAEGATPKEALAHAHKIASKLEDRNDG